MELKFGCSTLGSGLGVFGLLSINIHSAGDCCEKCHFPDEIPVPGRSFLGFLSSGIPATPQPFAFYLTQEFQFQARHVSAFDTFHLHLFFEVPLSGPAGHCPFKCEKHIGFAFNFPQLSFRFLGRFPNHVR